MKSVKLFVALLLALFVILPGVASADTLDDILDRGALRVGCLLYTSDAADE